MMVLEKPLEEYESVSRWLRDLSFERSGSESTKQGFLWVLKSFCGFVNSPDETVSECRDSNDTRQTYADKIKEFVMIDNMAKNTISMYSVALKSFDRFINTSNTRKELRACIAILKKS